MLDCSVTKPDRMVHLPPGFFTQWSRDEHLTISGAVVSCPPPAVVGGDVGGTLVVVTAGDVVVAAARTHSSKTEAHISVFCF